MDENKILTVTVPLERWEEAVGLAEKFRVLRDGILGALEKDEYGISVKNGLVSVFSAVCPEEYFNWLDAQMDAREPGDE